MQLPCTYYAQARDFLLTVFMQAAWVWNRLQLYEPERQKNRALLYPVFSP